MKEAIQKAIDLINDEAKIRFAQQGHRATGKAIDSITTQMDDTTGYVFGEHYLLAQDTGILPTRYSKHTPLGVIAKWVRDKGLSGQYKNSKGKPFTDLQAAYLIKRNAKIVGMHSTGRRRDESKQGFLSTTLRDKEPEVAKIIEDAGYKYFDSMIQSAIDETKRNIIR